MPAPCGVGFPCIGLVFGDTRALRGNSHTLFYAVAKHFFSMTDNAQNRQTSSNCPSSAAKLRESNMELLRCVAMLLVVGVHACFFSLGSPTAGEAHAAPLPVYTRSLIQALCIGSVNMFVLISGWFGIRPKVKSFTKLLYQVYFCTLGVYVVFIAAGWTVFSVKGLAKMLLLVGDFWFVNAYIGLYLLAPLINAFLEKATQRQVEMFLLAYFVFQFLFGWVSPNAANFGGGYSTMSFIFLYVLAHYVRTYRMTLIQRPPRYVYLLVFFVTALVQALIYFCTIFWEIKGGGRLYLYTSPTVILMALAMLLYFSRLSFRSRVVNWFAASSFSVYLFHTVSGYTGDVYKSVVKYIFAETSGVGCLLAIAAFVLAVYVSITLIDQLRIASWKRMWKFLSGKKTNFDIAACPERT